MGEGMGGGEPPAKAGKGECLGGITPTLNRPPRGGGNALRGSVTTDVILTERLDPVEYEALLRADFAGFAERCFHELNPRTDFATNWHVRVIAAKLTAVHQGRIRRLIINLPP